MKKIIIASLFAAASGAFAADVTGSVVRDYAANKTGYTLGTTVVGLGLSATHVEDTYNRVGVKKDFKLVTLGPVSLSAGTGVVYQTTLNGDNGFGLTVGAKATMPVVKNVDVVAGVDYQYGQDRIKQFNGNNVAVGVNFKF